MKLTKQGVRDLNDIPRIQPAPEAYPKPYLGTFIYCDHRRMKTCCSPCCGHYYCDDCGLAWDTYAEL